MKEEEINPRRSRVRKSLKELAEQLPRAESLLETRDYAALQLLAREMVRSSEAVAANAQALSSSGTVAFYREGRRNG